MRRFITFFILNCLYVCSLFAAIPKTLSYQAVVRDGSGNLITEKSIGVSISILLEDTSNVVYQEEHMVTTNKYGLISLTIGKESSFSEINWSGGSYFIQCQFDLNKDGFYDLKSCSPMQSVPYALYAENVSPSALPAWVYSEKKPSYSFDELDDKPFIPSRLSELEDDVNFLTVSDLPKQDSSFYESVASQITSEDTMSWNRKLSVESDPIYSSSVASHITSVDTLRWNEKLSEESDPIYSASVASHITSADTLSWNEKLSEERDPIYSASVASHITSADTLRWNEKLSEERDPIYSASVASHITSADTLRWNEKLSEERDPIYSASVASHITSADTLRWNEKLSEESDPIYSASVASHISSADTLRWNEKLSEESDPIYSVSVASHISSADTLRWNEKLSEESDPLYSESVASHITSADTLRWNEKLSEESDPIYSASVASQITSEDTMSWNRKLEISDLKDYAHKGELPIVPTKVSEFENDATYVTQADLSMLAEVVRELTQRVNNLEADNQQINRVVDSLKLETQKLQYKVDSMQAVSNDAIVNYAKTATPVYSFPLDSWTYAYEVYESLKEGDRVVFVVRHSERDEGCSGSECDLNANGINMVKEIGVKFRGGLAGVDDSYYGSSDAERCKTTSYLIATTRGDTHLSSNQDVVNPIEVLKSKYYGEDLKSWPGRAEYYNKNPEEVAQKSMVLVNDLLNRTKGKTFSWFTSHDYVMVPLVEWATNLGIDYEKYRGIYNGVDSDNQDKETDYFYWNNFLSGVAILVHKDNTFEIYPVKNLEDGFRYNRCYKDW